MPEDHRPAQYRIHDVGQDDGDDNRCQAAECLQRLPKRNKEEERR